MRDLRYRLQRSFQLLFILLVTVFICFMVWKLFLSKNDSIAADYQLLATISPDEIHYYQINKPESWKEYIAVITAFKMNAEEKITPNLQSETLTMLLKQLDNHADIQVLNWPQVDAKTKKSAIYLRTILDRYPIYVPGNYGFPLKQTCYYIDTYGADREGGKRLHQGTDLFDIKGTPIYSVSIGTVEKLGWNRLGGERVGIRGDDGNYYYYAHLDKINPALIIGAHVATGDFLGTMGNTGDALSTPDHLHFGIELPNGDWLNPYPFLKVWEYQNL